MTSQQLLKRLEILEQSSFQPQQLHVIAMRHGETEQQAFDAYQAGRQRDPVTLPHGDTWSDVRGRFLNRDNSLSPIDSGFLVIHCLPPVSG